ncbi:hypothetical protein H0Z60_19110 [Ectothiorhodospiraceae bacterium WFHF3C12]|nr:hypothetical protein [Ectothiorhodospiraceae bacterium WFHF3C12]
MANSNRPEPPDPLACCQGNCVPCIFDVYERELERWERHAMQSPRNDDGGPSPLALLNARMGRSD